MRLLDTHFLIRGASREHILSAAAQALLRGPGEAFAFSAASIWEIAIKTARGRADFSVDAGSLRAGLLTRGMREILMTSAHSIEAAFLPPLHKDPFDRMMVAQARVERLELLTADATLARYGPPVVLVR